MRGSYLSFYSSSKNLFPSLAAPFLSLVLWDGARVARIVTSNLENLPPAATKTRWNCVHGGKDEVLILQLQRGFTTRKEIVIIILLIVTIVWKNFFRKKIGTISCCAVIIDMCVKFLFFFLFIFFFYIPHSSPRFHSSNEIIQQSSPYHNSFEWNFQF